MKIAILGTGNVGQALATGWLKVGHEIIFGTREPAASKALDLMRKYDARVEVRSFQAAVAEADLALLAVPWNAAEAVITQVADWSGKVLVDATNPIAPGFALDLGHCDSGGEAVQRWAIDAEVVKAFNTTGYKNMLEPRYQGEPTAMFIAGDSESAKESVGLLAEELGFEVADLGALSQSRLLEPLAMVWIRLAMIQGQGRDFAFKLAKR